MYHTIVIGAGQAGLAIGYYLAKQTDNFLILEKGNQVGQAWKARYDSLILFTSKQFSSLPGLPIEGDPNSLPTKDEVADYLQYYARNFSLPIKFNTEVTQVVRLGNAYSVYTKEQNYIAKNVVIATGPFHSPAIPAFAANLSPDVLQLHSTEYKNPNQLMAGSVLVVGVGNSGSQIAVEVSQTRKTFLSTSQKLNYMPLSIGNKSIFWWFSRFGILNASVNSFLGRQIRSKGDPIFGYELRKAIQDDKVTLVNRTIDANKNSISFSGQGQLEIHNVIWATGFKSDYQIIQGIPGVLDQNGTPIHNRGITSSEGLFFLGLPWQSRRGSALLQGVGYDAEYLIRYLR
ncbi:NAD(P)-binding domain-containing protein [Ornithinibacillus massiliensis]|uniref:NAD(P)-binding domain-containing protein n=1 Tax=Ornithinibacillus massiliensis TaxID=1944633 RepID=A0ABS5MG99_9BACI|nr:NAD(P)/FAD-dependent oxidoreductase [Ornithinibacillus massiliensis]MBS3681338.1 NAD(P)-binding domain-containing protein [Ornithinibacillus massiliensis]